LNGESKNKTLFQFDPSCSNITNIKYQFLNETQEQNQCPPDLSVTSTTLSVLYLPCSPKETTPSNTWIIILVVVIIIVVVLAITFVILTVTYPPLKRIIFPHREKKRRRTTKDPEIEKAEIKLKVLRKDIEDLERKTKMITEILDEGLN